MSETITSAGTGFAGGGREWLLAMDTSTAHLTVALLDGPNPAAEWNALGERNHSVRLIPAIQELAASAGVKMRDLRAVAVGRGPGSYTGVRIGVTAGKTLAWSLGVPLIGVSSLEALALGAAREACGHQPPRNGAIRIVPLMDARRGQAYTAVYAWLESGEWACERADGIVKLSEWLDSWDVEPQPKLLFAGETEPFAETLAKFAERHGGTIVRPSLLHARYVGELARTRWSLGESDSPHAFAPNYTQLAEAEAKWLARRSAGAGLPK